MNCLSDDLLIYISKFLDNNTCCTFSDLHKLAITNKYLFKILNDLNSLFYHHNYLIKVSFFYECYFFYIYLYSPQTLFVKISYYN